MLPKRINIIEELKDNDSIWRTKDWQWQMTHRLTKLQELAFLFESFSVSEELKRVEKHYPFAITPYYLSLIEKFSPQDPIYAMAIPQSDELEDSPLLFRDPLGEESHTPVEGLIHRYPDRVVLLLTSFCPSFCRYCTRKRLVGLTPLPLSDERLKSWIDYLQVHEEVKDVILSGGDPLILSDRQLEKILHALRAIKSIEIIRIGTKTPVFLPMRITDELVSMLSKFRPLWVITHFNHPRELTQESAQAIERLLHAGIPVNNQSVLLKGINDHPDIIEELSRGLVKMGVRPYYLHQTDLVQGIEHFRTPISQGIAIMESLRGRLGGLAIPQYVVDLPNGGGKVPLLPQYIISQSPEFTTMRNFEGRIVSYPEPQRRSFEEFQRYRKGSQKRGGVAEQLLGLNEKALIPKKEEKK